KQAEAQSRGLEVVEQLRLMDGGQPVHRLYFKDQLAFNEEVGPKDAYHASPEADLDRYLALPSEAFGIELERQGIFIDRLEESVSEFVVRRIEGTDDPPCQ